MNIWHFVNISFPGRAEPNAIKFGDSIVNIKLNIRFLTNLIIKFDL